EFPNLFLLYGPNTNLGNNSVLTMIEAQVRYVLDCVRELLSPSGRDEVEVTEQAFADYQRRLRQTLHDKVWEAGCTSWCKTESGLVTNNWPDRVTGYRGRTRRPNRRHFRPV